MNRRPLAFIAAAISLHAAVAQANIAWTQDIASAAAQAQKQGKPIMLCFGSPTEASAFSDREVRRLASGFVNVKLDPAKSADLALAKLKELGLAEIPKVKPFVILADPSLKALSAVAGKPGASYFNVIGAEKLRADMQAALNLVADANKPRPEPQPTPTPAPQPVKPPSPAPVPPAPAPTPAPSADTAATTNSGEIRWITNLAEGKTAMAKADRPTFIFGQRASCGICAWVKRDILPREEIKAKLASFNNLFLDVDTDDNAFVWQKIREAGFKSSSATLPFIVVLSRDGKPQGYLTGQDAKPETLEALLKKAIIVSSALGVEF